MRGVLVGAAVAALVLGWAVGESAPRVVRTLGFGVVYAVVWSGDGQYVAVGESDVQIVDAAT